MHPEFCMEFIEDIHYCIFASFGVLEVFEANTKNQVHISLVEQAQQVHITCFTVTDEQFFIALILGRYVFQKCQ